MLYKNDEQYKLTATDIKTVRQKFPKLPVRFGFPEERVRKSLSPENRLPDRPASLSFPLLAVVKTPTGTDVWRYAENKILTPRGDTTYTPNNYLITGSQMLTENDIELIWFLWTKCPHVKDGLNYKGHNPMGEFENLVEKAELKAAREANMADIKALIYSTKLGLPEAKLRSVAKAMFIDDVDDMTLAQVKVAIEAGIQRDRVRGAEKFLEMINHEEYIALKSTLQSAVDRKLIKYNPSSREWVWNMGVGKKSVPFAEISPSADPHEALIDFYKGNQKFAQTLDTALKGNKVVISKDAEPLDEE